MTNGILVSLIAAGWVGSGLLHAGLFYAHFQRKFPTIADQYRAENTNMALVTGALLGPVALFATLASGFFRHGWLFPGRRP